MKRVLLNATAALLCGVLCIAPTGAGVLVVAGQEGTDDPPEPTEGASTEEDWNPVVTCTVPEGGGIDHLLDCLLDQIATPPPLPPCLPTSETGTSSGSSKLQKQSPEGCGSGAHDRQDFIVTRIPPPEYGVEIRRLVDGSEIERIALRENDPGIQTTELRIDRPGRVARVRLIEQQQQGGSVHLTINNVTATTFTTPSVSVLELNASLLRQLRNGGLTLTYVAPYLYVRDLRGETSGVNRVQFRSTDPGITQSDLGLYPDGDPVLPADEGPALR